MSKQALRATSEVMECQVSGFKQKHPRLTAWYGGTKVGALTEEEQQAVKRATAAGDTDKMTAVIDGIHDPASELYLHMPLLVLTGSSSIRSLDVYAYSAEDANESLLHTLLGNVRRRATS